MPDKKKATDDLCKRLFAIALKHAKLAYKEMAPEIENARLEGVLAVEDMLITSMMGDITHHTIVKHAHIHKSNESGVLIHIKH